MTKQNDTYVFIHLGGEWVPCGFMTIRQDQRDILTTFQYGKRYLQRRDAFAIDPVQLPLGETLFRSTAQCPIFGAIRDAAPDAWGRHLLDRAADPQAPGEFEYLTALPVDDRVGALGFGSSLEWGPGPIDPGWPNYPPHGAELDLENMLAAVDQIQTTDQLAPGYRRFLIRGSSLGGAQPKAPTMLEGRHWIAKFGRRYEAWNTCRIENANLHLAKMCGLTVPAARTLMVGDRDLFIIERFDRNGGGGRIPFISAATLLATEHIQAGSYADIAVQMRKYCAADSIQEDLMQLYQRMVFNILCNNSDDHLRNHGFIYLPGRGWRLSPVYDVVPQPDMGPKVPRQLTLGVGMDGSKAATLPNALTASTVFGLTRPAAKEIIERMTRTFTANWEKVYAAHQVPAKDFPALAEAFVNHLR